ncbi:DNA-binding transcriptional regulator, GntR family [Seinonella peptonophila]|uniref:DNA-binding transcriptional regulator, GntR family n=2 Tax=Seinonella peptonophila TaxID=112248 RepID=A0A1M4YNE3_9BACL|nr:DNA-binding transcriptional regulator, GntR family [Seinonella peptonophila]
MSQQSKIDEVVDKIEADIIQGVFAAGQRLPAERILADELNVSRATIRTALLRLQAKNLIEIVPRGGAFVRSGTAKIVMGDTNAIIPKNMGPELQKVGSFIHLMRAQGKEVIVRYIEPSSIVPAGSEISKQLKIDIDEKVLRRYRVQIVDRVPYRMLDTYLLASLMGELVGQEDHQAPLFHWLKREKNIIASKVSEKLSCRMPSAEEASILNMARNQPVVQMHRHIWGTTKEDEILFEYSRIICNAALHDFQYHYSIDDEALL